MKKITTFLALLLTCIIGATAADFVPQAGTKYLIKCKGDNNVVCTSEGTNILKFQKSVSEASYFTFESEVVENVTYFYIHPAGETTKYVYTKETPSSNNDKNDAVVGVTDTKDNTTCLWKITFNYGDNGQPCAFNITPKGYDNYSWNCRKNGIGYWHTGGNNNANNSWYITPNVELNGYYTIKNTATDRFNNLYNDFDVDNVTRAAENLPTSLANNYVWHVTTANGNVLTVLNGQGTPLYHDGNGNASLPTLNVAYSNGTKYYFGEALNGGNASRDYKLTVWTGGDYNVADNQWTFTKVEANTIYNVVCNIADGYVTYKTTNEKAKNGGFFIISSTPTKDNFIPATVGDYDAAVLINGNTINVNYTYNLNKIKELAKAALNKTGVGYPTANAATRTALETAVKTDDAAAIENALNAFKRSTEDIQMPEDGKAYRIKVPYISGTVKYLYSDGNGETNRVGNKADNEITDKNDEVFVCHIVNGKYMFATNHGTYLSWADSQDNNKGYNKNAQTTNYIAQNDWTIEPATLDKGQAGSVSLTDRADVFGLVQMKALGKNGTTTYYLNSRIDGDFISQYSTDKFYDTGWQSKNRSCYYQFEEVEYPNEIRFNAVTGINGVNYIATFSAPFATIIPADVKAYYVSAKDAKDAKATMTAIDAQAIPANEGVILTSQSNAAVTMVPAASETAAAITGNQLGNSAGVAKELTANEGYILGTGSEGTAFYPCNAGSLPINKAYLLGNGHSAIAMNFGNAVTGINNIVAPANAKAPIFDLSGRRVVKTTKGLYIQNGKKFIVK